MSRPTDKHTRRDTLVSLLLVLLVFTAILELTNWLAFGHSLLTTNWY